MVKIAIRNELKSLLSKELSDPALAFEGGGGLPEGYTHYLGVSENKGYLILRSL